MEEALIENQMEVSTAVSGRMAVGKEEGLMEVHKVIFTIVSGEITKSMERAHLNQYMKNRADAFGMKIYC